ncbi:hypothetical protein Tco_0237382 [Tanacetum coccineum]
MKRASKGYSGVNTPLFQTMLVQDQCEGPTIPVMSHHTPTSVPSTSQPPSTPPSIQATPVVEEADPMPHDLPLLRVYSLRSDEGSLSLNELTVLCTSLSKKVESLESELKQTKQTCWELHFPYLVPIVLIAAEIYSTRDSQVVSEPVRNSEQVAIKMKHYLAYTDYPIWEVIQNGNGPVSITTDTSGQIKV